MEFNIIRIARVVINVTDLDRSRDFYVNALGFVETECDGEHIYLRGLEEHTHHSLVLKKSDQPGVHALGYKVASEADLDKLSALFQAKGLKTKWLEEGTQYAIGRALHVHDVSGMPLEFFCKMDRVERMLQRYDQYKGARIQRIDHVNCMVPDVEKAYDFFMKELGFACSEYTVTEKERIWAAWLHRKQGVHDQAFMNGEGPRLHHIGFWLPDPLALIHCCDILASIGYAESIERGPGRHGLSNAFFLYLRDPDGYRIELYNGDYLTSDPDFIPIRWELDDPRRQTFWGHKAPESWFNETFPFLDIDTGEPIPVSKATLEKIKPEFIL
ncbi:3,4-dihydroxyphenylacetate 2,3-dioxygenase [Anoxybacteroides rupiense]|uniref:3,4-dihydroxyphenylacetate 2,3-dioxygenase n=1 Tax=Anoxybacteroides rupiense TaxID=311460 RepID=A0ABD5IYH1_9BACL|nr:3,4-dihydroxyphenylacetate 2,3-dioxygenase [Anoxybacillus rupiensis]MBB3908714.1 catechol 2,3-dioxygenase [Anoxybacillus rupiensis]MED5053422.1 3,4-dihydroxyphenylacetate 2,3-dioxygenase [Anoxybacillus rupiensis]